MKKGLLLIMLLTQIAFGQINTSTTKSGKYQMNVPDLGAKKDSAVVWDGTSKLLKILPISEIKSITNLDYLATPTGGTVFSSSGNDASVPLATTVNAGLFSPSDKNKLNGIAVGATANDTDANLKNRANHTGSQQISTVVGLQAAIDAKLNLSLVGVNNGVAPLDPGGKISFAYLPASLMIYKGMWNPATNTPTLSDASGTVGWVYKTNAAGTANLGSGNQTFFNGDFLIHNGTKWERSAGTDAVVSVNGQQGIVTLSKNDVGLGSVDNTTDLNKPISTATQTALNLKANLAGGNTFTGHNSFHLGSVSVAEPTLSNNPTTRNYVDSNFQLKIQNPITGTGSVNFIPKFTAGSGILGNSNISSFGGDLTTPSYIHLDNTFNSAVPDFQKLKLYLFRDASFTETYGLGLGGNGDVQYWAGGEANGMHTFYTSKTKRLSIHSNGNVIINSMAGVDIRQVVALPDGTLSASNSNMSTYGTFTPATSLGTTYSLCYWSLIGKLATVTYNFSYLVASGGSSVILSFPYPAGITDANIINNSIRGSGTLGISATNKFGISLASNSLNNCILLQTGTLSSGTYTGSGTITFLIP